MILCASSTSIPSRFRTTVDFSTRVSAISRVSSIEDGLMTQTSIFTGRLDLLLLLIGVILEEVRTGLSCFGAEVVLKVCFGAGCFTSAFTGSSSSSSSSSSKKSFSSFFLPNFWKNFFTGFSSSSSSSRKSSSSSSRSPSSRKSSSSYSSFSFTTSKSLSKTPISISNLICPVPVLSNLARQIFQFQHAPL